MAGQLGNKNRATNIELLRIMMTAGVVLLHLNYSNGEGLLEKVTQGSLRWSFSCITEVISISAINVFLIISGYFLSNTGTIKIGKTIKLIVEVMAFSCLAYVAMVMVGKTTFSIPGLLGSLIPNNYYITFYICIITIAPFITKLLDHTDRKSNTILLLVSTLLFLVWPFIVNLIQTISGHSLTGLSTISIYGDGGGYNLLSFLAVYIIGVAIRRELVSIKHPMITLLLSVGVLFVWKYGIESSASPTAFAYNNPVIVLSALSLFELFKKMKIKQSALINYLGFSSLAVFLLHPYVIILSGGP